MALPLKQSTAVTLKIGQFLDETDGKTAETALTIAQADVRLSKNGGNMAQKNEATSCTHDEIGVYDCPVDATDTATLGRLDLYVHESGALPVHHEYEVLPANVYDSLYGSDLLQVDVTQVAGDARGAVIVSGTAVGIADGSITLASGQGTTLSGVESLMVILTGGTNAIGKSRFIAHDTGDVFSVDPAWNDGETTPSGTITYLVVAAPPSPETTVPDVNLTKIAGTTVDTAQAQLGVNVVSLAAAIAAEIRTALGMAAADMDTQLSTIDTVVDAVKAKTDNLPATIRKNVAIAKFPFVMKLTDGSPGTGLTVTVQISKDGGAFATLAGTVTEVSAGHYYVPFSQTETNADVIAVKATATGASQLDLVIHTQP